MSLLPLALYLALKSLDLVLHVLDKEGCAGLAFTHCHWGLRVIFIPVFTVFIETTGQLIWRRWHNLLGTFDCRQRVIVLVRFILVETHCSAIFLVVILEIILTFQLRRED